MNSPGSSLAAQKAPHPWSVSGGDNSRRGQGAAKAVIGSKPRLKLKARGAVHASPVFDEADRCFVADMAGWVQAFAPEGRITWQVQLDSAISSTPAVDLEKGRLFAGTHRGSVYALETSSGATLWRKAIPSKTDPRILSDILHLERSELVVLSSWGGQFVALDAKTGQERFAWSAGVYASSAAAADAEENVYCIRAVDDRGVECVRVDTSGKEQVLHREPADDRGVRRALVAAGPVIDDARDLVCFVLNRKKSAELLGISRSGAARWRGDVPFTVQTVPTMQRDGSFLLTDLAGAVLRFGPEGRLALRHETGCEYLLGAAVANADGVAYLGDPWGRIHQVEPDGTVRILFEAPRSIQGRPSFDSAGRLCVPCTDRSVYVL